jgi:hypothetical protein
LPRNVSLEFIFAIATPLDGNVVHLSDVEQFVAVTDYPHGASMVQ